jgi:uncharacterized membrane protein
MATKYLTNLARALLGQSFDDLSLKEQRVIKSIASGEPIAKNTNQVFQDQSSYWERLADSLAQVVGSWPFIFSFFLFLFAWVAMNTLILSGSQSEFDAYPYILLNLVLSTLASIQAPVIMMSQNRQAEKDRLTSSHAFEVNLKIELAIQQLHDKVDKLLGENH